MQVIITHTDPDGWVSAKLVYDSIIITNSNEKILSFTWNYGNDYEHIDKALTVHKFEITDIWMTDITLPNEFMEKYANLIHHYDHHKSILESSFNWKENLKENASCLTIEGYEDLSGNQAKQIAACELVWLKLIDPKGMFIMPNIVRYVGRYDVWDHYTLEPLYINAYITYMMKIADEYRKLPWYDDSFKKLFNKDGFENALVEGQELYKYSQLFNSTKCKKISKAVKVFDYIGIVANISGVNSKFFDSFIESNKDKDLKFILTFSYKIFQKFWTCSCYSIDSNFSSLDFINHFKYTLGEENIISLGGHRNACGFTFKSNCINEFLNCIGEVL